MASRTMRNIRQNLIGQMTPQPVAQPAQPTLGMARPSGPIATAAQRVAGSAAPQATKRPLAAPIADGITSPYSRPMSNRRIYGRIR
jgi:hypothetical protein